MKKKVIVTGGLGFIGSNLIELLLNKSYQVINIDKNTYSSNFYNVKEFKNNKNYSFIKCDIASPKLSKIIFKSNPTDQFCTEFYCAEGIEYGQTFGSGGFGFIGNPQGNINRINYTGSDMFQFSSDWEAKTNEVLTANVLNVNIQSQSNREKILALHQYK